MQLTKVLALELAPAGILALHVSNRHLDLVAVAAAMARAVPGTHVALADDRIDAVYASDLSRAHATAQAVAQHAGVPLRTDTGLRERGFGVFEGLTFAEVEQRFPEQARRWRQRDAAFGPEGGETLRAFYERAEVHDGIALSRRSEHLVIPLYLDGPPGPDDVLYGLNLKQGLVLPHLGLGEHVADAERKVKRLPENPLTGIAGDPTELHEGPLSGGATLSAAEHADAEDHD